MGVQALGQGLREQGRVARRAIEGWRTAHERGKAPEGGVREATPGPSRGSFPDYPGGGKTSFPRNLYLVAQDSVRPVTYFLVSSAFYPVDFLFPQLDASLGGRPTCATLHPPKSNTTWQVRSASQMFFEGVGHERRDGFPLRSRTGPGLRRRGSFSRDPAPSRASCRARAPPPAAAAGRSQ